MTVTQADAGTLWEELAARVAAGDRFAGLFGTNVVLLDTAVTESKTRSASPRLNESTSEPSSLIV